MTNLSRYFIIVPLGAASGAIVQIVSLVAAMGILRYDCPDYCPSNEGWVPINNLTRYLDPVGIRQINLLAATVRGDEYSPGSALENIPAYINYIILSSVIGAAIGLVIAATWPALRAFIRRMTKLRK